MTQSIPPADDASASAKKKSLVAALSALATLSLLGAMSLGAPAQSSILDRVDRIRDRISALGGLAPAPLAPQEGLAKLQAWNDWDNWSDWGNWDNWNNWNDWGNWGDWGNI